MNFMSGNRFRDCVNSRLPIVRVVSNVYSMTGNDMLYNRGASGGAIGCTKTTAALLLSSSMTGSS